MYEHSSGRRKLAASPASTIRRASAKEESRTRLARSAEHFAIHPAPAAIQPKLTVNTPGDAYEQEADRVADQVMRMSDVQVQRKCAECEENEEKGMMMRSESGSGGSAVEAPAVVHDVIGGSGSPLDNEVRSFMEPRFGHDFSNVRVHTDAKAAESAQAVNARAYTVGNNVVFGAGQYQPTTSQGRSLMAHELTHVVQQSAGASRKQIQRWSYGSGTAPHSDYTEVPEADKKRIDAAMGIVSKVVNNPKDYPTCPKFFKDNCPGGTDATLTTLLSNAIMWKDNDSDPTLLGSSVDPSNIAYTKKSYGVGRWAIAASMFHELIHNCGVASHDIGDDAKAACGKLPNI